MSVRPRELIAVRALTDSDLGIFQEHRAATKSKQRALQINVPIARRMLSPEAWARGKADLDCVCRYLGHTSRESRRLYKSQKNWRLGGHKIKGPEFAQLQAGDFALIRSQEGNDGSLPISLIFVCRKTQRIFHAGLATVMKDATGSMALFTASEEKFDDIVNLLPRELIAVRSLAESDLGLFTARRGMAAGRQRAININAVVAKKILDAKTFERGGGSFDCACIYGTNLVRGRRKIQKSGKNWRLGGDKIDGDEFGDIDCKDFVLLRSVEQNSGQYPLAMVFISRKGARLRHAGLVATVGAQLNGSMALYLEDSPEFVELAKLCPWPHNVQSA
jgi:hypothetical protein